MTVGLLKDIVKDAPKNTALLGLDVGKKTIGIALSTPEQNLATPLTTIKRTKFAADMIGLSKIAAEYEVGGYIIGLPVNMDGTEGRSCQSIRDFATEMENALGQDTFIALWDERLSTSSVEDLVDKSVDKRKTKINSKSSGLIDKLAAQIILSGALEFIHSA